jgi:hypothetical protein
VPGEIEVAEPAEREDGNHAGQAGCGAEGDHALLAAGRGSRQAASGSGAARHGSRASHQRGAG